MTLRMQFRIAPPALELSWRPEHALAVISDLSPVFLGSVPLIGPRGETGAAGPVGPAGADGAQGETGSQGPQGISGNEGADGLDGQNGVDGLNGSIGPDGPIGLTGPAGPQGEPGPAGPQGSAGIDGSDGLDGADGADGLDGQDGSDGLDGSIGPQGPVGLAGSAGTDGLDGADGADGLDGQNGVDGQDGQDGAAGLTGPEGPTGAVGPAGPSSAKQIIGIGGRWYLNTDNRWVGFPVNFGAQTDNYGHNGGTAAEPDILWNQIGPIILDGGTVNTLRMAGRVNSTEVTAIDLRLFHQTGPWEGTWNSVAETTRTQLFAGNNILFPSTDLKKHIFNIDTPVIGDGFLLMMIRPVGTLTTTRYLPSSISVEWEPA